MKGDKPPLVSVIVLNWNGQHFLENCFTTLNNQAFKGFEVILVDNASTDSSVAFTREKFPNVSILQLSENKGYVGANNAASQIAKGKYLFFLNNDTKVDENCLLELAETAEDDPSIGILGCRELTYDEADLISEGVSVDIFGYPCDGKNIFYADGAALFIRAELFHRLNGFDSQHFIFFEDLDIGWRTWLSGHRVECQPKAVIYHKIGGAIENEYGKKQYTTTAWRRYLSERNNLRNILKNYSAYTLSCVLPLYLAVNLMEFLFLCLTGSFRVSCAVYPKSWSHNLKILRDTLEERRKVQQMRQVGDLFILKKMEWKVAKLSALLHFGIPKFTS